MKVTCTQIAKMIDHSLLKPTMTSKDVIKGCRIAKKYDVASVCVKPCHVNLARKILKGSDVLVTTVIGFPHGSNLPEVKTFEAEKAVRQGCVELDMVMNIGAMLSGDYKLVAKDIRAVSRVTRKNKVVLKVILENCYLNKKQIAKACRIAEKAGADFVKTSTGYGTGGATIRDLKLMRKTVSKKVQVKAAGGVRTLDAAIAVRKAGCTRFGATATEKILKDCKKRGY